MQNFPEPPHGLMKPLREGLYVYQLCINVPLSLLYVQYMGHESDLELKVSFEMFLSKRLPSFWVFVSNSRP